jgi:hypothetical protein
MIGWLLALMPAVARRWVLRLPVTLLPFALAAGIYLVLRRADGRRRRPPRSPSCCCRPTSGRLHHHRHAAHFLCFASVFAFWLGIVRRSEAGRRSPAHFGLAFLSKYFAVLLGLAYVAYVAFSSPRAARWRALALVVCSLPFCFASTSGGTTNTAGRT